MSFIELARTRRSVRKYHVDPVPDEIIRELLEAARLAPSGCNVQPWRYLIIKDPEMMCCLKQEGIFWQDFVYGAPLLIIGCGDLLAYENERSGIRRQIEENIQPPDAEQRIDKVFRGSELERLKRDVAISMAHIVYRAEEIGLGTCFIGSFYRERLAKFLTLPENIVPILSLAVGYPAENPEARPRKPLEDITYRVI